MESNNGLLEEEQLKSRRTKKLANIFGADPTQPLSPPMDGDNDRKTRKLLNFFGEDPLGGVIELYLLMLEL